MYFDYWYLNFIILEAEIEKENNVLFPKSFYKDDVNLDVNK